MAISNEAYTVISKIALSDGDHEINAKYWNGHEWEELAHAIDFIGSATTTMPTAGNYVIAVIGSTTYYIPETTSGTKTEIPAKKGDVFVVASTAKEYICTTAGSGTGSGKALWTELGDENTYASKAVAAAAGTYTTTGSGTLTTSEAGSQTATGKATITYKKSDTATGSAGAGESANTGEAGSHTIQGSNFSFSGTSATISGSTSYRPAGTISNTYTDAATVSINNVTGAALDATPSFSGTTATLTVPGGAVSASGTYTPAGTISKIEVGAHSHTVNAATTSKTVVTGASTTVSAAGDASAATVNTSSAGSHTHSITPSTQSIYQITGVGSAATLKEGSTAVTNVLTRATVSNTGVLSFVNGTFNGGSAASRSSLTVVTGVSETGSAGAHTHSIDTHTHATGVSAVGTLATTNITYMTGATLGTAGAHTITPTFYGTEATINVSGSVADSTFSYRPAGTVSKPGVSLTKTATTVAKEGIKAVTSTFSGTTATITVSAAYTPAGSIAGSQTVSAHSHTYTKPTSHTHSIGLTDTRVTGTASVAVSSHTHSIDNHTHNVTLPNCAA